MTASEAIQYVIDKISPRGAWCQKAYAMSKYGHVIGPNAAGACKWCVSGALLTLDADALESVRPLVTKAAIALYGGTDVWVNDRKGKAAVLLVLAEAKKYALKTEATRPGASGTEGSSPIKNDGALPTEPVEPGENQ